MATSAHQKDAPTGNKKTVKNKNKLKPQKQQEKKNQIQKVIADMDVHLSNERTDNTDG